jgi:hypothetical protein
VSRIESLLKSYGNLIQTPWQKNISPEQRVIFCIYNENEERALRVKIDEFKYVTEEAEHFWLLYDLTNTFAHWLCKN